MKRKEWLLLFLAFFIISGAAFGLYQYRFATKQTTETEQVNPAPKTSAQTPQKPDRPSVKLIVSRDFAAEKLIEKEVTIETNDTVMDVLKRSVKEVKTAYGGGFVESIDGLSTGYHSGDPNSKKLDWFYYVNGKIADVGAAEYPIQAGDVIWWDYHSWEVAISTPAAVGAYPHPFLTQSGEQPQKLTILVQPGFEPQAEQIAQSLSQLRGDQLKPLAWDEAKLNEESVFLLVGDQKSMVSSPFVKNLLKEKQTTGLFFDLNEKGILALTDQDKQAAAYSEEGIGLVASTLHPASRLPVWIITGIGKNGVQTAASALHLDKGSDPSKLPLYGRFGLLLTKQGPISLPIEKTIGAKP